MREVTLQDQLPLSGETPAERVREARADAMTAAGIRPPQRYEVTSGDHFDPVRPRRTLIAALHRLIKRWR